MNDKDRERLTKLGDYLASIVNSFSGPIEDSQLSLLIGNDQLDAIRHILEARRHLIEARQLIAHHLFVNR